MVQPDNIQIRPTVAHWPVHALAWVLLWLLAPLSAAASEQRYNPQVLALYQAYEEQLTLLRQGGWSRLTHERVLRLGDEGPAVSELRARMGIQSQPTADAQSPAEAVFDADLLTAVQEFQAQHGLTADGVVGKRTRQEMNISVAQRLRQIALNIERWDRLPADFNQTFMLVNLPEFELTLYQGGSAALDMRVVIGKKSHPTPEMVQQLQRFVLNPTWYVPRKIGKRELLPKLQEDPSYLDQQGMDVYREGRRVDAQLVDWSALSNSEFDYSFRQRPGPGNSLGRVKFLLPNSRNIYLHDTPHQSLFATPQRARSHGCIRLEQPLKLARALFAMQSGWSEQGIARQLRSQRTVHIDLEHPVPVHLAYMTAKVEDGKVWFFEDVYSRDRESLQRQALPSSVVTKLAEVRGYQRERERNSVAQSSLLALPAATL